MLTDLTAWSIRRWPTLPNRSSESERCNRPSITILQSISRSNYPTELLDQSVPEIERVDVDDLRSVEGEMQTPLQSLRSEGDGHDDLIDCVSK